MSELVKIQAKEFAVNGCFYCELQTCDQFSAWILEIFFTRAAIEMPSSDFCVLMRNSHTFFFKFTSVAQRIVKGPLQAKMADFLLYSRHGSLRLFRALCCY